MNPKPHTANPSSLPKIALVGIGLVAILAGLFLYQHGHRPPATEVATLLPTPKPLTAFELTSPQGSFTPNDLKGHWSVLYFGYTHCPDVCPATLSELATLFKSLPASSQLVFVSIDYLRDHADQVDQYAHHFNPNFHGVTGTQAEINRITHNVGAMYTVENTPDGGVSVDHSGALYLINPQGEWVAVITPPFNLDAVARDLTALMKGS